MSVLNAFTEADRTKRGNEINALNTKLTEAVADARMVEKILNKKMHRIVQLRKNLYGILNTVPRESELRNLIEHNGTFQAEAVYRRYAKIVESDLITNAQLSEARKLYQIPGKVEIDEDAVVSADPDLKGILWAQAWVLIYD